VDWWRNSHQFDKWLHVITQYPCGFSAKNGWKSSWIVRDRMRILSPETHVHLAFTAKSRICRQGAYSVRLAAR
jgi:hypothetical protein